MELRSYSGESLGIIRTFKGVRRVDVKEPEYRSYLNQSNILRFSVGVYNETGGLKVHDSLRITLEYKMVEVNASIQA